MLRFKLSFLAALATTLAATASPIIERTSHIVGRQAGVCEGAELVTCTLSATVTETPNTSIVPLFAEWNYLYARGFAANLGTPFPRFTCSPGNSTVTGPLPVSAPGPGVEAYTVTQTIGSPGLTSAQSAAVVQLAFAPGTVVPGEATAVDWTIGSVVCDA